VQFCREFGVPVWHIDVRAPNRRDSIAGPADFHHREKAAAGAAAEAGADTLPEANWRRRRPAPPPEHESLISGLIHRWRLLRNRDDPPLLEFLNERPMPRPPHLAGL